MRIVGGKLRGKKLLAPEGGRTRPTADRAREALFNILEHGAYRERLRGGVFADLFAGTGAVGLEALSRGAETALFIERDPAALSVLRANIASCGLREPAVRILTADATNPPAPPLPVDILFLDPPYEPGLAEAAITPALSAGWLAPDGVAIVQMHPKDKFVPPLGSDVVDERRYGAARMIFLERADG